MGFNVGNSSTPHSVKNPTSNSEFKPFAYLNNPYFARSSGSSEHSPHEGSESGKAGLGLINSLTDETKPFGEVVSSTKNKNIVFAPKFKLWLPGTNVGSGYGNVGPVTPQGIKTSEEYTRVTFHGPNPKTIHFFGDTILKCHPNYKFTYYGERKEHVGGGSSTHFKTEFLKICNICKDSLNGKDIYMYRGDGPFCSEECRFEEMLADYEAMRRAATSRKASRDTTTTSSNNKVIFFIGDTPINML